MTTWRIQYRLEGYSIALFAAYLILEEREIGFTVYKRREKEKTGRKSERKRVKRGNRVKKPLSVLLFT